MRSPVVTPFGKCVTTDIAFPWMAIPTSLAAAAEVKGLRIGSSLDMTNRLELAISERFAFAGGHEFGSAGAYERLVGRAHFAIDPKAAVQKGITDLEHAALDGEGRVRFAA